jgi:hypothetical protein
MTDEKPSTDDTTPDLEPTPAEPAPAAPEAVTTTSQDVAPSRPRRTRELMAAGAAGLLVAGGLAGFGIGRATGGDDGPRFTRSGQFRPGPGYGRPGQRGPGGGNFGNGQGNQQGPGQGDGQQNGQSGGQPPADGPGTDGT